MPSSIDINSLLQVNEDFQSSVNILYDLGNRKKIEGLIPTSSVCRYLEELLEDVMSRSTQRAKFFVGAYGKGKSHIALTALAMMHLKEPSLYGNAIDAFERIDPSFAERLADFVSDGPRLLPVVISGNSTDLARSFLYALRGALRDVGLEDLMPRTNYGGALETVQRWREEYPATYAKLEEQVGMSGLAIEAALKDFDSGVYASFLEAYPALTSGSTFDTFADADVVETYSSVLRRLKGEGYSGIYVVFDEFSKYLESSIATATIEDVKLLQDFAEACNRSEQDSQLHLLLISHKNLSNYIDAGLPKEKVDGWRGISGRFVELEIHDDPDQAYELMSRALRKDPSKMSSALESVERDLSEMKVRYITNGLLNGENADSVVADCYPLHPLTAFLLPRVSELIAQNERTLFTFLSAAESDSLPSKAERGEIVGRFVTPDLIYDYFEPLLRKERIGTHAHNLYLLTRSALSRIDGSSLESRIVKTLTLIHLVACFNQLPPTKESVAAAFVDAGYPLQELDAAMSGLIEKDSLAYLRRSDSRLKLKESSGVNIEEAIADRAEMLKTELTVVDILNDYQNGRALYPSRHNNEYKTTRYFECLFDDQASVMKKLDGTCDPEFAGDGAVVAIIPDSVEGLNELRDALKDHEAKLDTVVFALPKTFEDVSETAYRFEAAARLREEARGDDVLRDEYAIVLEDHSEVLSRFIAKHFWPEKGAVAYYHGGHRKNGVTHRKKLSSFLSDVCDQVYAKTPIINNEVINKNEPTGIALTSRAKILTALCSKHLEPNLGFIGNGQEMSIARSVLSVTGAVRNFASEPEACIDSANPKIGGVLAEIDGFLANAAGDSFAVLYERLTSPAFHIGAKRGPIPILLALVLREYRERVCIMREGEELPIDRKTLEDIDGSPEKYSVTLVDWDDERAAYVSEVGFLFGGRSMNPGKSQVAELARAWYVSLPQFTRLSKVDHTVADGAPLDDAHDALLRALSQQQINASDLLFDTLPHAFGCSSTDPKLVQRIKREVYACESYVDDAIDAMALKLQRILSGGEAKEATCASAVATWLRSLSPDTRNHVFSGAGGAIMSALSSFTFDTTTSMRELAEAVVSLRIEDWDDALYERFFQEIEAFVAEVNAFEGKRAGGVAASQSIAFVTEGGSKEIRSFESVECSPRANLLRSQILSAIEEMGRSISNDEKRQVVFEVLKEMCS